jgi:isocitrate/isopropylmalate dehydrogenase
MMASTPMNIAILPGDGIGPEIMAVTVDALARLERRFALGLRLRPHEVGLAAHARSGSTLPDTVIEACRAADGFVLGPVGHHAYPPRAEGGRNPSGELRIALDLYANIRPSRSYEGLAHYGRTPMDLVIVRENTEGFYADRNMHQGSGEFMPTPDLALSVRKVSAQASRHIAGARSPQCTKPTCCVSERACFCAKCARWPRSMRRWRTTSSSWTRWRRASTSS